MNQALEGMRVLEWTTTIQGPSAGAMLTDLGAEVVKMESKETGDPMRKSTVVSGIPAIGPDGVSLAFSWLNRNKKSIAIDLKAPGALDVVHRILRKSDVFLTNFRPSAAARVGLSYEQVRDINPRLIYAQFSGMGTKGPYGAIRAMASSGLAVGGILMIGRGPREGPIPGDHNYGDQMGAIAGTQGILAALLARERYGIGQKVSASITSGALWVHQTNLAVTCLTGKEFVAVKKTRAPANALIGTYRTNDGKWIAISMGGVYSEELWYMLCEALGRPRLAQDPRFAKRQDREANNTLLFRILQRAFRKKTRDEWMQIAKQYDLVIAPVNTLAEAINDQQLIENQYVTMFDHPVLGKIKLPGMPFDLSETPGSVSCLAPRLGEHTEYVLKQIAGYNPSDIEGLKTAGVVA